MQRRVTQRAVGSAKLQVDGDEDRNDGTSH
jgi:hypothetical protein